MRGCLTAPTPLYRFNRQACLDAAVANLRPSRTSAHGSLRWSCPLLLPTSRLAWAGEACSITMFLSLKGADRPG